LDTTVVVTSCNRHDLLARTLQSFFDHNTDRSIARVIVVEDGDADPTDICRPYGAEAIRSGQRIGQIRAIDLAYAHVQTPYIFHLEDDWEFYRSGFIEKSRAHLEADPFALLVWLRAWNDTNGHPLSWHAPDGSFGMMAKNFLDAWHGFTFNPGLRRLSDYRRLGSYFGQTLTVRNVAPATPAAAMPHELEASLFYHRLGYHAIILDCAGYVRHIGEARHVAHPFDVHAVASRNSPCPCGSGRRYKHCHGRLDSNPR